jgi:hypothetical protein
MDTARKAKPAAGATGSEFSSHTSARPDHNAIAGPPQSPARPWRVVTIKANSTRVIFSKHETRRAAEDMVAGLAKNGLPAHVECSLDDTEQPGEAAK